ncbi:hypothetical protein L208DRAFT_1313442, partial [Tricholoma matsutake]
ILGTGKGVFRVFSSDFPLLGAPPIPVLCSIILTSDLPLLEAEVALIEGQQEGGDLDSADATIDQALLALQERYKFSSSAPLINHSLLFLSTGAVLTEYTSDLIMKDWDDVKVRKG